MPRHGWEQAAAAVGILCSPQPFLHHVRERNLSKMNLTRRAPAPVAETIKLKWWKEVLIVGSFYLVYSVVRNRFGSALLESGGTPEQPFHHAVQVIKVERLLGLFHENAIQNVFLPHRLMLRFWNVFYGTAHFLVTIGTFITLFVVSRARFVRWRNALAFTTALALIGFSLYPLMPPRLLNDSSEFGGAKLTAVRDLPGRTEFHDTLKEVGGLWSFDSGAMTKVSNQYAAMPSLHSAWSTWCALALWPIARRRWAKGLLVLYPVATVLCIIVTGNHYWLDAIGGLLTLAMGWLCGNTFEDWNQRRITRRALVAHTTQPRL
jgi:membrane-associated phospholipid phosphatase